MKIQIIATMICLAIAACADTPEEPETSDAQSSAQGFIQVSQDFAKGRFLQAFLNREKARASSALYGQIHAAVGWTKEAKTATHIDVPQCTAQALDAALSQEQSLTTLFSEYDVVILNESHERPRHRATAIALLPALQNAGFDIFTAETFSDGIEKARARGYPLLKDGIYTKEPVFGHLVRSAAKYGFDMYRYEPWPDEFPEFGDDYESREKGQARLIGDLVRAHPNRKVFVYSGRGHLKEHVITSEGDKIRLMGWFLKNDEGIEALTISQTTCAEGEPGTELAGMGAFVPDDAQVDAVRIIPEESYTAGRPDWLWKIDLNPVSMGPIDKTLTDTSYVLVEVYNPYEHQEAVPVDRLIVRKNIDFVLAVPQSGDWHWRVIDASNTIILSGPIGK